MQAGLEPAAGLLGVQAPDFELASASGEVVRQSSFRGKRAVLVVFYPFAFSATCTSELDAVRDSLADFQNDRVQVLGVSADTKYSLRAYADARGYEFPLLSDFWPHGAAAQAYGVFDAGRGMAVRGTFLIDTSGVIRFAAVNGPGQPRDQDVWRRAIAALR